MQNMWISVALIVAVIIVGIIAGKRLSAPGPQRRAVYFAFGTLAVLALWFFILRRVLPRRMDRPLLHGRLYRHSHLRLYDGSA